MILPLRYLIIPKLSYTYNLEGISARKHYMKKCRETHESTGHTCYLWRWLSLIVQDSIRGTAENRELQPWFHPSESAGSLVRRRSFSYSARTLKYWVITKITIGLISIYNIAWSTTVKKLLSVNESKESVKSRSLLSNRTMIEYESKQWEVYDIKTFVTSKWHPT